MASCPYSAPELCPRKFGNVPGRTHQTHREMGLREGNEQSPTGTARLSVMAKRTEAQAHQNERILRAAALYE